jgi:hypothetical protein
MPPGKTVAMNKSTENPKDFFVEVRIVSEHAGLDNGLTKLVFQSCFSRPSGTQLTVRPTKGLFTGFLRRFPRADEPARWCCR